MKSFQSWLVLAAFSLLDIRLVAQSIELGGDWNFAVDPIERGEQLGWAKPDAGWKGERPHPAAGWDAVTIPHDFLVDPRFAFTGTGWYRRSIAVPANGGGRAWRLQFAQVSQRCRVWLNGEFVGAHEGGYTPFEFVVTSQVRPGRQNFLVVAVDNRVRFRALPGARSIAGANGQLFPWLQYGGILGGVALVETAPTYLVDQRIESRVEPEGGAEVWAQVRVRNATRESQTISLNLTVGSDLNATRSLTLVAGAEQVVTLQGRLSAAAVKIWSLDAQPLYRARTVLHGLAGDDVREDTFGLRTIETREGRFLLNGAPVRWAGANRARGHPEIGGRDSDAVVERDLSLMKAAGLRFARLQHTPPQRNLLDWADRNGMLLILEVGAWGYPAADLASPELRDQFQFEMRELVAFAANHPSVVGWSVGNEYESWTPEGVAWTRDMAAFVKALDPTRLVTFAAIGGALRKLREEPAATGPHAFDFVDFLCTNIYFSPDETPAFLDPVHTRWPNKPVMISEFGLRADRVKEEAERIAHFDRMLALVRARPWVCGLSFWSFNDYASHYPGSGADGYRRWGLVDEFRQPRPLYEHVKATIAAGLDGP